jgi:HAD superfamily hydrolase (TIGR01458 family)
MGGREGLQGVLFDLDGVLYDAGRVIPGAAETVAWAREQGIAHLFVTNTTSRPRSALVEKLAGFGIETDASHIHTPAVAAAAWLHSQQPGEIALFVREAARADFAGLPLLPDGAEQGASYVVIGDLGESWDFRSLNRAFRLLHHNPNAVLIALGMTRYWQAADGISLDVAPFVAALEHATGQHAVVLGKPAKPFFLAAAERLGLPPGEVVMVGDDARADVAGAQAAGLRGVLVKTGKFRATDLTGEARPDGTIDSIAELPLWWMSRH